MKDIPTNKKTYVFSIVHVLIWAILFLAPLLFLDNNEPRSFVLDNYWMPLIYSAILFYLNYFLLINKYFIKKQWWRFILVNLVIIVVFALMQFLLKGYIFHQNEPMGAAIHEHLKPNSIQQPPEGHPQMAPKKPLEPPTGMMPHPAMEGAPLIMGKGLPGKMPALLFLFKDVLLLCLPVLVALAARLSKNWLDQLTHQKEIENQQLISSLDHLRYQLQPHFFFNALNNIYVLIDLDRAKAKETVHIMSKLMRYLLYDTRTEKVKLSDELDFVRQYISLMKLRLPVNAEIDDRIPYSVPNMEIAPLIFIALVENAHKHGVSSTKQSKIVIEVTVESECVKMIVGNSNFPKYIVDDPHSGIGLINLKKRLDLLYPGRYKFEQMSTEDWYETTLEIYLDK